MRSGWKSVAIEADSWDLKDIGNVELDGRNLLFRLQGLQGSNEVIAFMATFNRRDVSKTLINVERSAKLAGLKKSALKGLMKAVSSVIPDVFRRVRSEEEDEQQEAPTPQSPEMLAEADREAEEILNSQDPLAGVDRYLGMMVCGEVKNRQRLFLKCLASRTKDKRVKWIVVITGTEGAGKSTLMSIVQRLCVCKVVGRMTRHALDYTNLQGYDVLVLKEIGRLDQEDQGVSTLKFLSLDDDGYTVEVATRDPETGEMTTKTYKIPPINVLSSSTRVGFDLQFERRTEMEGPDESEEQTEAVKEFKAELDRQHTEVQLGRRRWRDDAFAEAVLKAVLAKLEDVEVEIPFPSELNRVLRSNKLRVRGDVDKIYASVRLYHLLRQRSQKIIEGEAGKLMFASPAGAVTVIELFRDSLETMLGGLDKRTRGVIEGMAMLGYSKGKKVSMRERMEIAKQTGRGPKTVYMFFERMYDNQLVNKGKEGEGRGSPVFYELLADPREMFKPTIASQEEVAGQLHDEMMGAGFAFLSRQGLPRETLSAIARGWRGARGGEEKRIDQIQGADGENASRLVAKSFRSMWRRIESETSSNQANGSLLPHLPTPSTSPDSEGRP